jgi:pimeloyl-ACP methyl ester carboxylesterase
MKEDLMQKTIRYRSSSGKIARLLGLSFIGALIFTAIVSLRHILETPLRLESPLPGESHYYKWERGYIFYKVLGAPEASPLLLLHAPELAASAYEMRKIIEPLAQHYRVYTPDLIGFGFSDRPAMDYSAETYLTLCRDFLSDVVKQPATIVASRISCNYAVGTAATFPDLCERLVLISPVALEGTQERVSLFPALKTEIPFMNVWPQLLQTALVKWLLYPMLSTRFALHAELAKQHVLISNADIDYYYAASHQFGAQHASMALLAGKLEQDVSQQLAMLQQPTLVIWGAKGLNDARHITSQQGLSWMKAHIRFALLPDAGLAVHEEYPETVIATILSWNEERTVATQEENIAVEAYCAKCKTKRGMLNATEVTAKNGRMAIRGTCEVCGSNLHRFGRIKQQSDM